MARLAFPASPGLFIGSELSTPAAPSAILAPFTDALLIADNQALALCFPWTLLGTIGEPECFY